MQKKLIDLLASVYTIEDISRILTMDLLFSGDKDEVLTESET